MQRIILGPTSNDSTYIGPKFCYISSCDPDIGQALYAYSSWYLSMPRSRSSPSTSTATQSTTKCCATATKRLQSPASSRCCVLTWLRISITRKSTSEASNPRGGFGLCHGCRSALEENVGCGGHLEVGSHGLMCVCLQ